MQNNEKTRTRNNGQADVPEAEYLQTLYDVQIKLNINGAEAIQQAHDISKVDSIPMYRHLQPSRAQVFSHHRSQSVLPEINGLRLASNEQERKYVVSKLNHFESIDTKVYQPDLPSNNYMNLSGSAVLAPGKTSSRQTAPGSYNGRKMNGNASSSKLSSPGSAITGSDHIQPLTQSQQPSHRSYLKPMSRNEANVYKNNNDTDKQPSQQLNPYTSNKYSINKGYFQTLQQYAQNEAGTNTHRGNASNNEFLRTEEKPNIQIPYVNITTGNQQNSDSKINRIHQRNQRYTSINSLDNSYNDSGLMNSLNQGQRNQQQFQIASTNPTQTSNNDSSKATKTQPIPSSNEASSTYQESKRNYHSYFEQYQQVNQMKFLDSEDQYADINHQEMPTNLNEPQNVSSNALGAANDQTTTDLQDLRLRNHYINDKSQRQKTHRQSMDNKKSILKHQRSSNELRSSRELRKSNLTKYKHNDYTKQNALKESNETSVIQNSSAAKNLTVIQKGRNQVLSNKASGLKKSTSTYLSSTNINKLAVQQKPSQQYMDINDKNVYSNQEKLYHSKSIKGSESGNDQKLQKSQSSFGFGEYSISTQLLKQNQNNKLNYENIVRKEEADLRNKNKFLIQQLAKNENQISHIKDQMAHVQYYLEHQVIVELDTKYVVFGQIDNKLIMKKKINIIKAIPVLCKVRVDKTQEYAANKILNLNFKMNVVPYSYRVYVSTVYREPNEQHHECLYVDETKFTFEVFTEDLGDWIYFTIDCEDACMIELKLQFEGQISTKPRKIFYVKREEAELNQYENLKRGVLLDDMTELTKHVLDEEKEKQNFAQKEQMIAYDDMNDQQHSKDFVELNINNAQYQRNLNEVKNQNIHVLQQHKNTKIEQANIIKVDKINMYRMGSLSRIANNDYHKQIRENVEMTKIKRINQKTRTAFYNRQILLLKIFKELSDKQMKYLAYKEHLRYKKMIAMRAPYRCLYRRRMFWGRSLEFRLKNQIRRAFIFIANVVRQRYDEIHYVRTRTYQKKISQNMPKLEKTFDISLIEEQAKEKVCMTLKLIQFENKIKIKLGNYNLMKKIEAMIKQTKRNRMFKKRMVFHAAKKEFRFLVKYFKSSEQKAEELSNKIDSTIKKTNLNVMLEKLHRQKYTTYVLETQRYLIEVAEQRIKLRKMRIQSKNSIFESLCLNQSIDEQGLQKKMDIMRDIEMIEEQIVLDEKLMTLKQARIVELENEENKLLSELYDKVKIVDKIRTHEKKALAVQKKYGVIHVCFSGKVTFEKEHHHDHDHLCALKDVEFVRKRLQKPQSFNFYPTVKEVHKVIFKILVDKYGYGFDNRNVFAYEDLCTLMQNHFRDKIIQIGRQKRIREALKKRLDKEKREQMKFDAEKKKEQAKLEVKEKRQKELEELKEFKDKQNADKVAVQQEPGDSKAAAAPKAAPSVSKSSTAPPRTTAAQKQSSGPAGKASSSKKAPHQKAAGAKKEKPALSPEEQKLLNEKIRQEQSNFELKEHVHKERESAEDEISAPRVPLNAAMASVASRVFDDKPAASVHADHDSGSGTDRSLSTRSPVKVSAKKQQQGIKHLMEKHDSPEHHRHGTEEAKLDFKPSIGKSAQEVKELMKKRQLNVSSNKKEKRNLGNEYVITEEYEKETLSSKSQTPKALSKSENSLITKTEQRHMEDQTPTHFGPQLQVSLNRNQDINNIISSQQKQHQMLQNQGLSYGQTSRTLVPSGNTAKTSPKNRHYLVAPTEMQMVPTFKITTLQEMSGFGSQRSRSQDKNHEGITNRPNHYQSKSKIAKADQGVSLHNLNMSKKLQPLAIPLNDIERFKQRQSSRIKKKAAPAKQRHLHPQDFSNQFDLNSFNLKIAHAETATDDF